MPARFMHDPDDQARRIRALVRHFSKVTLMFMGSSWLLVLFVLGIIAMFIGMGFRDHNPGIFLMGVGFLAVLIAVIQKAIDTFG